MRLDDAISSARTAFRVAQAQSTGAEPGDSRAAVTAIAATLSERGALPWSDGQRAPGRNLWGALCAALPDGDRLSRAVSAPSDALLAAVAGSLTAEPGRASAWQSLPPAELGDVHGALLGDAAVRRHHGAHYTPAAVADDLVRHALVHRGAHRFPPDGKPLRVLDPAAGGGRFLVSATQQLPPRLDAELTGLEADPLAAWVCDHVLRRTGRHPHTVQQRDTLRALAPGADRTAHSDVFDLIVGNPPFGVVADDADRPALRAAYPLHRGAFDRYRLFFELTLARLAPGGRAALLLPTTWIGLRHAEPLRRHLLAEFQVLQLVRYGWSVFPEATVDVAGVVIERTPPRRVPVLIRRPTSEESLGDSAEKTSRCPARELLVGRFGAAALLDEPAPRSVPTARRLVDRFPPLDQYVRVTCGLKPYQRGKGHPRQTGAEGSARAFESSARRDADDRPLLVGRMVHPFAVRHAPDSWIRYGPWLAEPRDPALFDAPHKLVARQTGDRLIVGLDEDRCVARDSTLVLVPRDDELEPERLALWLLAVLNSSVATWLFRLGDPDEVKKPFSQVRRGSVARIPTPPLSELAERDALEAVELSRCLVRLVRAGEPADSPWEGPERTRLEELVASAYGLTRAEAADATHVARTARVR